MAFKLITPPKAQSTASKVSLRWMLTIPFMLQVTFLAGWVGYLTYRNGQQSVEYLTQQLLDSVSHQVEQKLITYLNGPILANQSIRDAVQQGRLSMDLSQKKADRDQYLWQQMQLFPSLTWISLGSAQDDSHGIHRPTRNAPLQMTTSNRSTQYFGEYWGMQAPGVRNQLLKIEKPEFYPTRRPWYRAGVEAKETIWTPIYAGFSTGSIFIASSQPLYDRTNKLVGVSGIDLSLSEIQDFLIKTQKNTKGQIFIMERSGLLVASSTQERSFRKVNGQPVRIQSTDSRIELIRETSRSLRQNLNTLNDLDQAQAFNFRDNQQNNFVQVLPFSMGKGLDWLIVIVVPEAEVMTQIQAGNQFTLLSSLLTLIGIIVINLMFSQRIVRPILELSQAIQGISSGSFKSPLELSKISELSTLTLGFNQMSHELQVSRQKLDEYARSLEKKVADRTSALKAEVDRRANAEAALKIANYKLKCLAYIDGLTQIPNRRSFDERLQQEWKRAQRTQTALSLVICDVDYFKKYNDTYGHQLGDDCLCAVAQTIASLVRRPSDLAARYGGEEFVMLLPETDTAGAMAVAQAIRSAIHALCIEHRASEISSFVTMSFGVATVQFDLHREPEDLLKQADQALYQSKQLGRDRISTIYST